MCHGQGCRFFGDGKPPTFNRNPYNGYINPYYWVDDHPLLYGNNGSLDPGTHRDTVPIPNNVSCRYPGAKSYRKRKPLKKNTRYFFGWQKNFQDI